MGVAPAARSRRRAPAGLCGSARSVFRIGTAAERADCSCLPDPCRTGLHGRHAATIFLEIMEATAARRGSADRTCYCSALARARNLAQSAVLLVLDAQRSRRISWILLVL